MTVYIEPRDWWIGYFRGERHHYVCPLPCLVIRWPRRLRHNAPTHEHVWSDDSGFAEQDCSCGAVRLSDGTVVEPTANGDGSVVQPADANAPTPESAS